MASPIVNVVAEYIEHLRARIPGANLYLAGRVFCYLGAEKSALPSAAGTAPGIQSSVPPKPGSPLQGSPETLQLIDQPLSGMTSVMPPK